MPTVSQRRDGVLLVDKPAGLTSHDAVTRVRHSLGVRRIGHAGTLDPFATGLLVMLVGRATRLLPYVHGEPKTYEATIAFGTETDTDDLTGVPTRQAPLPEPETIRPATIQLTGVIEQIPPAYSAKQVHGQRAYQSARRGAPLVLAPVKIEVLAWDVRDVTAARADVVITCSGGTYVRALARDLGRLVGSAAHLERLRRTRSGEFRVTDAVAPDGVTAADLRPALASLGAIPVQRVDAEDARRLGAGRMVRATVTGPRAALIDDAGDVVAIAERADECWQPRVVLVDG
jgi:tRNA pseudouridine55 synthase